MHARHDSAWYFSIAYTGYSFEKQKQSNVSFFPLYPMLMRLGNNILEKILPGIILYYRYLISGTLISVFSLFIALIYLFKILKLEKYKSDIGFLVIFFILIFPTSYFFTSVYSESLYLMLIVLCFYFHKKEHYLFAGLSGYLASLTRFTGIFLLVPIIYDYINNYKNLDTKKTFRRLFPVFLIPAGLISYMYFLSNKFGDPFLFIKTQENWGRIPFLSIKTFGNLLTYIQSEFAFNYATSAAISLEIIFLLFGLSLGFLVTRKMNFSYGLWSLISVLFPIVSGTLVSQGRYTLVVFPLFIVLAKIASKNIYIKYGYIIISTLLLGLNTILFVNGYWSV